MFRFLIDTCVWLDLAKDPKQAAMLEVLETLLKRGMIELIVPRVVVDEFKKNRDRIAKESQKSLASQFRLVREAVGKVGGDSKKVRTFISQLDDVAQQIPQIGGHATDALTRIQKLLSASLLIEATDTVKVKSAQRAIDKRAPFHRDKNAMADAIILETYAECVCAKAGQGVRFAFITHNKSDFSAEHGNPKHPHPDFAGSFSRIKSLYFINLAEALRRVEPSLVSETMIKHSWTLESRGISEILGAEQLLFDLVWYNRHMIRRKEVELGKIKILAGEECPEGYQPNVIKKEIWIGATRAAIHIEKKYGKESLGPWDDFEWGMINGKMSALRWVIGDDWDMLDT